MNKLMKFRNMAFGLMLGAAPLAGFASNDSQSILSSGAKAVTATVSVDKGMVITNPESDFDTLKVDVAVSGLTEGERSEFVVRLSDPAGSFEANTTEIARLVSDTGANVDTIVAWIVPDTVPEGDFYKVGVFAGTQDTLSVETLMFRIKHEYAAEKQIPNSGFEVWMNEGEFRQPAYGSPLSLAEPVGWHSFKTATGNAYSLAEMFGGLADIYPSANVRPGSEGQRSVQVTSKFALIATANGNLTTGKINMGTATAADITQNYNFSDMEDPAHAVPFTTVPDSLTFWVQFEPTNDPTGNQSSDSMQAAVTVTIHDDFRYQDPTEADSIISHVVAKAQQLFYGTKGEWVRYSLPFTAGQSTDPRYILVSVTTNINPGVGVSSMTASLDTLWLDDMLMIYNPTVSLNLAATEVLDGIETLAFDAVLDGTFNPSNLVFADSNLLIVEADTLDDFSTAQVVYSRKQGEGNVSGNLDIADLKAGKTWYVRARTTNYPAVSESQVLYTLEDRAYFNVQYGVEGSEEAEVQVFRNAETEALASGDTVDRYDSLTFIVSYPEDEKLLGWYENGILFASTDTVAVDSVMRDYALTARLAPRYYSLEISGVSEQDGSVLVCYAGSGDTVADLDRIEVPADLALTAIPAQYRVLEGFYTADSVLIGRTSPLTFHMAGDTAVHVRFARQTGTLTINLMGIDYAESYTVAYAESGEAVEDRNAIELPAELTLTAEAIVGNRFEGFYAGTEIEPGNLLSSESPFTFTMEGDTTLTLLFGPGTANESLDVFQVRVYPNPASEVLHVSGKALDRIELFSTTGLKVADFRLEADNAQLEVSSLPQGLYIYKVYDKRGSTASGRFLKL